MQPFAEIYARAAAHKGGEAELAALLAPQGRRPSLARLQDDRVLAEMTRCVFRSGFVWKVIEAKWPGFEAAFHDFDVTRCAMLSDEELEALAQNAEIVRNAKKIASVRDNAQYVLAVRETHGAYGKYLKSWPADDFVGLWDDLKRRGSRLGGQTGRFFLRFSGYDTPMLSADVVAALIRAGVVDKEPTSKRALAQTQDAFNAWRDESGRTLTEISRILAFSEG